MRDINEWFDLMMTVTGVLWFDLMMVTRVLWFGLMMMVTWVH